jgi:hypothetical protein
MGAIAVDEVGRETEAFPFRTKKQLMEEFGVTGPTLEVLIVLSGIERKKVGTFRIIGPGDVGSLREAHSLYVLCKSLPTDTLPALREAFRSFRERVEALASTPVSGC